MADEMNPIIGGEMDPIIEDEVVVIHHYKLKTRRNCVDKWCEVIRHRYCSIPNVNNPVRFEASWRETHRGQGIFCSTLTLRHVDEGPVDGKFLTIQIYHTNQNDPEVRTIYVRGDYCRQWIATELQGLKNVVREIYQQNITDPSLIQHRVDSMPAITLPGGPNDVAERLRELALV